MTDNKGFFTTNNLGDPTGRFYISKDVPNERSFEDDKLPDGMTETFKMVNAGMFSKENQMTKIHCDVGSVIVDEVWAMPTAIDIVSKNVANQIDKAMTEYFRSGHNMDGKHVEVKTFFEEFNPDKKILDGKITIEVVKNA